MENSNEIVQQYFDSQVHCHSLMCHKVIFDPVTKREWFFEDDRWCYFEFYCDDEDYSLKRNDDVTFSDECYIKDMSYEIIMLLAYVRLRGVSTIEKSLFSNYVNRFETAKSMNPDLSVEKFNFDLREREETALIKSDKIANGIMGGCLLLVAAVLLLFLAAVISYFKTKF